MGAIRGQSLKLLVEAKGPQGAAAIIKRGLEKKELHAADFSLREIAEACLGERWVRHIEGMQRGGYVPLVESGTPVGTTAFANIIGQLLFSEILQGFRGEEFVFSREVSAMQSRIQGTEDVPGIGGIGDKAELIAEGQEYPSVGFGEERIQVAAKDKRGFIVEVTQEAVFYDRTGLVLERGREVGKFMGLNKEKRVIDAFIGATNNYKRNGTGTNTFLTTGAYVNSVTGQELVDWTDVEALELVFADLLDPNISEPIEVLEPNAVLIVTPWKKHTARRILNATEIRTGDITQGAGTQTVSANPVSPYRILTSKLLYRRILLQQATASKARDWHFLGDLKKAIRYVSNWDITVSQAPAGNEAEFTRDITARYKVSEKGVAQVWEPRYLVRAQNAT